MRSGQLTTLPAEQTHSRSAKWLLPFAPITIGILLFVYTLAAVFTAGEFKSLHCLLLACCVASLFFGVLVNSAWRKFAFWVAVGLIGQAASLQMIDAGRRIHFQHFRQLSDLAEKDPILLVLVSVQTIAVFFGILARRQEIVRWIGAIGKWRLMIIGLVISSASAAVTPDPSIYFNALFLGSAIQIISICNLILIFDALPDRLAAALTTKLASLFGDPVGPVLSPSRIDAFALTVSILVVLITATLSFFVYEAHPHVPDETQYIFQAKYMAEGQLTVTPPRVPEAFSMYMVPYLENRWYSIFPPAFPAVLAVGVKAGAAWLVNPLLSGICILLAYLLFRELYSRSFARIAVILMSCSPWFLFMGMSFMSHMFALLCGLAAALCLLRSIRKPSLIYSVFSGVLVGVLALVRPFDGFIVAGLFGVWALTRSASLRHGFSVILGLAAGVIPTALLILPYDLAVTGASWPMPLELYYQKYFGAGVMNLGFGPDRGMGWGLDAFPGHSPLEALINFGLNLFQVNTELFGWSAGSLAFVAAFMILKPPTKQDLWAIASIVAFIAAYALFWYHGGPDFGARYWFLCFVPMVSLAVRGMHFVSERIESSKTVGLAVGPRILTTALVLCAFSLITYIPWRSADKYFRYLNMEPGIIELAKENGFGHDLVLIRGNEHPDYQSAWIYNPVDFDGRQPLYAWEKDSSIIDPLVKAYPDRKIWVVDGPTLTGNGYVIRQGPLSGEALLRAENMLSLR